MLSYTHIKETQNVKMFCVCIFVVVSFKIIRTILISNRNQEKASENAKEENKRKQMVEVKAIIKSTVSLLVFVI